MLITVPSSIACLYLSLSSFLLQKLPHEMYVSNKKQNNITYALKNSKKQKRLRRRLKRKWSRRVNDD